MQHSVFFVKDIEALRILADSLTDGYVPDPVLMPTGRPNVIEGIGAIYHLVKAEVEAGIDVQKYIQSARFAEPQPLKAPEFADVELTADMPHGQRPEGEGWEIHAVYQKNVIWVRRKMEASK